MTVTATGPGLVDRFGRVHTDLRLSITDRCSLRCTYCMPAQGMPWLARSELLTDDEIVRAVRIAVGLGITAVRLTGGEPLIRHGVVELVARLAQLRPRPELSVTTNGLRLPELARPLAEAGLARVNVSLDTIRPDTFRNITRRDGLDRVLSGLAAAADAGLRPVKVNAVLIRGLNDNEACELLRYCLRHEYELRFIESMPLDGGHAWRRETMVTADEILTRLRGEFSLTPSGGRGNAPAETWWVDEGPGRVGVIGAVTGPFCGNCNRVRLTADGQVRNCLFAREESDLRTAMRGGATDEELARRWIAAIAGKAAGHGIDDPTFVQPTRPMSAIGG
jgi:GTP 3',8-cyclase